MSMRSRLFLIAAVGVLGCGRGASEPTATRTAALTSTVASDWDTFINSAVPDNNNGASPSLYTGHNGQGGMMRGLVRFALPIELQGRVIVSRVRLTLITRGTGFAEDVPPTPATLELHLVTTPWSEGVGIGNAMTMFTVGEPCNSNGNTTGATWNQPNCAGGTPWTGGSVAAWASGAATVPAALAATVTWDSASGHEWMVVDVQSWIDDPDGNFGWRLTSSTETNLGGSAQKFYSREETGAKGPVLMVDYACKAGYVSNGTACDPVTDGGDATAGAGGAGGAGGTTGAAGTTGTAGTGGAGGATGAAGTGGGAAGTTGAGGTGGGTAGTTGAAGTSGGAAGTTGAAGTGGGAAGTTGAAGTGGGTAGTTGAAGAGGGAAGGTTGSAGTGGAAGTGGGGTSGATAGTSGGRGGTTGTAGSAAGRGGSSGAAGATGRGGSGTTGTAGTAGNTDDSGCGCAVGARDGASRALGAVLAVAAFMLRRRRR